MTSIEWIYQYSADQFYFGRNRLAGIKSDMGMKKSECLGGIAFILASISMFSCAAHAQVQTQKKQLDEAVWDILAASPGVEFGGDRTDKANIQMVCDVHCPHCARLYEKLTREHQEVKVRWVPVSYFRRNSESQAAAILSSKDPAANLAINYLRYDYKRQKGWHGQTDPHPASLGKGSHETQNMWRILGGYTPMIIVKDVSGKIQKMPDGSNASVAAAIRVAPAKK